MSVKRYGVYLAYPPTVDLRAEGLGRLLAAFLKGAQARDDVRLVVACPSWSREAVLELCQAERVHTQGFDLISPAPKPWALRLYEWSQRLARRRRKRWWSMSLARLRSWLRGGVEGIARWFVGRRSGFPVVVGVLVMLPVTLAAALVWVPVRLLGALARRAGSRLRALPLVATPLARLFTAGLHPKELVGITRWYAWLEEAELEALHRLIDAQGDVVAWYCPSAFWPSIHRLTAPRLICVPDLVLADFAAGYAELGGERFLERYRQMERTLIGGGHYLTFGRYVKEETVVRRFGVAPERVEVVHHGANRLDPYITVSGFSDDQAATDCYCRNLIISALNKAIPPARVGAFGPSTRFLFYASQFRPHKNLPNLLRAYEYLIRRRYISCRLVLTGDPRTLPGLEELIASLRLEREVLCLHGLTVQELAACYRLADLAVNPSLFEGGLPFTFSEALSVGTPVVSARIPVTEEILTDPELAGMTLFDPHDWRGMAERIEWGLGNRQQLLSAQTRFFDQVLAARTWEDVVSDQIAILDRISLQASGDGR